MIPLAASATFYLLLDLCTEESAACSRQIRVHVICGSTFPLTCQQNLKKKQQQPSPNHFTQNLGHLKPDNGFIFRLLLSRYCKTRIAAKSLNNSSHHIPLSSHLFRQRSMFQCTALMHNTIINRPGTYYDAETAD